MPEEVKVSEAKSHQHAHGSTAGSGKRFIYILAFMLYLAVALVMFYKVSMNIGTVAPGTGADTYQNLWDVWWVKYAVFNLHTNPFYTSMAFWPLGANLAFVTLAPLMGVLSAPLQAFGTVFAYNVMFFLGFALSGLAMCLLARRLTGNWYASIIAGFAFTFSAFHIAQSLHIHYINIEFVPLFFYFFIRLVDEGKGKWYSNVLGMSASLALTAMIGNIEQTIMLFMAFVLLLIVYLFYKEKRKAMLSWRFGAYMAIFIVAALAIGSWNFIPLVNAIRHSGGLSTANYLNTLQENALWSIPAASFFVPSFYNGIIYSHGMPSWAYSIFAADPIERVGYIGYAAIALILFGIYTYRKDMLPWAVCSIIFIWLAMGPAALLYDGYHALPAVNVIREPGRFDMIATLFMSILVAYGAKAVFEKIGSRKGIMMSVAVLAVILAVMFIENNGMPLGSYPAAVTRIGVPGIYAQLQNVSGNFSVLELPDLPTNSTPYLYPSEAMYYTSITHKPLVGGYTGGRQNVSSLLLLYNIPLSLQTAYLLQNSTSPYSSPVLQNYTNQTLLTLYNYNTEIIIVQKQAFDAQQLQVMENYLSKVFGGPVYNDNATIAFGTAGAFNRSVFNSYVAYPLLTDWSSASVYIKGGYRTYWIASVPGTMIVYAPYPNSTGTSARIIPSSVSYINSTISFSAISSVPQKMYVEEPAGLNKTRVIGAFSVNSTEESFSVNTPMVSGPEGNTFYFVYFNSSNNPVLIRNITFSRQVH